MAEFGEKLKQAREQSGMTQAMLAEQLYVTRQAVSRWECGARYPDLLMTRKIAQILEVSIDELVSGEELAENIEREPVLSTPGAQIMQTALYSFAAVTYLLMSILAVKSLFPDKALLGTPAGEITVINIVRMGNIIVCFFAVAAGLVFSVKNTLTPKRTGIIMSAPYGAAGVEFVLTVIDMLMQKNGSMSWMVFANSLLIYVVAFVCIILYFQNGRYRILSFLIYGIAAVSILQILYAVTKNIRFMTELSFTISIIHCMGKLGLAVLLLFQTYIFSKKIKAGIAQCV